MRLCDKCGKARGVRRVTLNVDAGVDWRTEIELELCDVCAASFYWEADKFIEEMGRKFADFKASMSLVEPEEEKDEVAPELRELRELGKLWREHSRRLAEWVRKSMRKAFAGKIKMVLKAKRERQCAVCGLPALKPVRCPKCGAWVCSEHLKAHMENHYVKLAV